LAVARVTAADSPVVRLDRLTWQQLAQELTTHRAGSKGGTGWMPAEIQPGPRKGDRVQSVSVLALDIEAKAKKQEDGTKRLSGPTPPPLSALAAELDLWGVAAILATSYSHEEPTADGGTLGPRYRITMKLSRPMRPDEVRPLALHVAARLGVSECVDTGCMEPDRLFYLPRCPADRMHLAESAMVVGEPLDVDDLLRAAQTATKRRAVAQGQTASVIDAFNAAHDLPTLLARHGYKQASGNRWLWPGSTTGMPGVVFLPETQRVFSAHTADPLHDDKHARDVFDAWCALEHGGDVRVATREAARLLGMARAPGGSGTPSVSSVSTPLGGVHEISPPQPLPDELSPVEPFPLDALPEAFRPWVADVAERMHCPPDFVAVPMLVAAASLVARHVGIRPQQRTDWLERGNLWGLLVARPGWMKSPALSQAMMPMDRLEARAAAEFNAQVAQHQAAAMVAELKAEAGVKAARAALKKDSGANVLALLATEDEESAEPTRRRYVVNDLTYEKLGEILAENPDGVLSVRDEMRGLFLSLAREEAGPARGFYLQAWSGGSYTFDRIGRGTVTVADSRLSIIGGIQPGPLSELVQQARRGAADDGMIERFLISWPDAQGEWREVDRWPDSKGKQSAWETFERLDSLTADALRAERETDMHGEQRGLPFLRFDDDAREAFGEWRSEFERTIRSSDGEGLEGALTKFRHHVPALALSMHVIDGGIGPVGLPATLRALALAEYFESHARRLHGSSRRVTVRAARTIISKARASELPAPFTARDVYRNQWTGLSDRAVVADALDMLASLGWLTEAIVETGGRPTAVYGLTEGARRG
jgi:putative DNA primase/helicase